MLGRWIAKKAKAHLQRATLIRAKKSFEQERLEMQLLL